MDTTNVPSTSGLRSDLTLTTGRGLPCRVRSLASPTPIGRLTSLRTRDLTLGGALKKSKVMHKNKGSKNRTMVLLYHITSLRDGTSEAYY